MSTINRKESNAALHKAARKLANIVAQSNGFEPLFPLELSYVQMQGKSDAFDIPSVNMDYNPSVYSAMKIYEDIMGSLTDFMETIDAVNPQESLFDE